MKRKREGQIGALLFFFFYEFDQTIDAFEPWGSIFGPIFGGAYVGKYAQVFGGRILGEKGSPRLTVGSFFLRSLMMAIAHPPARVIFGAVETNMPPKKLQNLRLETQTLEKFHAHKEQQFYCILWHIRVLSTNGIRMHIQQSIVPVSKNGSTCDG